MGKNRGNYCTNGINLRSVLNITWRKNRLKTLKKGSFEKWHNISAASTVKRNITYREITIAIGIIVAMVIALTLWTMVPEEKLSLTGTRESLPAIENLFSAAVKMFSEHANTSLDRP